jgi:hypothetical protein
MLNKGGGLAPPPPLPQKKTFLPPPPTSVPVQKQLPVVVSKTRSKLVQKRVVSVEQKEEDVKINMRETSGNRRQQQQEEEEELIPEVYHKRVYNCDKTKILVWFNFIAVIVLFILVLVVLRPSISTTTTEVKKEEVTTPPPVVMKQEEENQIDFVIDKMDFSISLTKRGINFESLVFYWCCTTVESVLFCGGDSVFMRVDVLREVLNVTIKDESMIGSKCKVKIKK